MFQIHFSSKSKKEFDALMNKKILEVLNILPLDPLPVKLYDVKKLQGIRDTFRIRIGKVRIIYTIIWNDKAILISRISTRESAYD